MFFYKKNIRPYLKHGNAIQSNKMEDDTCFWNQTFDKGRLKIFVLWFLKKYGEHKTIALVEELKIALEQCKCGMSFGYSDYSLGSSGCKSGINPKDIKDIKEGDFCSIQADDCGTKSDANGNLLCELRDVKTIKDKDGNPSKDKDGNFLFQVCLKTILL